MRPDEKAEVHDLQQFWSLNAQPFERYVHQQQFVFGLATRDVHVVHLDPLHAATVLMTAPAARLVHEDATHDFGGRAKEMPAVSPLLAARSGQPQPSFVDERGGLERLAGRFVGKSVCGELAQFAID